MDVRKEFEIVLDKYGVNLESFKFNGRGGVDIRLDHNIYYKSQEDMMNELRDIYPVDNCEFSEVA